MLSYEASNPRFELLHAGCDLGLVPNEQGKIVCSGDLIQWLDKAAVEHIGSDRQKR
jgi:hypothetical protein